MCTNNTCNPQVDCPYEDDCPICGDSCDGSCGGSVAESICVVPSQVILPVGQWAYLSIEADPEGVDPDVKWHSDDDSVAAVGPSGNVYAVSPGFANIFAVTKNGLESYCFVQVREADVIPVTSVTLDRSSLTLQTGEHCILNDTVCPGNATNPALEWHSDNDDVARVEDGVVYAVGVGETFITAISVDNRHIQDTCTVRVYPSIYVESITLGGENTPTGVEYIAIQKETTYNMRATVCPGNATHKSLEWSSNNTSVATVSQNGVITGKSAGRTTICVTALDGSGVTAECDVWVIVPVESVVMVLSEHTTGIGRDLTLVASVQPVDANDLYWHSSNPSVATVVAVNDSRHGLVTTHAAGYTTIYATSIADDSITAICKLYVQSADEHINDVSVMRPGETLNLNNLRANSTSDLSWTSSDPRVVSIDENNIAKAERCGNANLTAKRADGSIAGTNEITVRFSWPMEGGIGHGPGYKFATPEAAAVDFAYMYYNVSKYIRREIWSLLYKGQQGSDEYFSYTNYVAGKVHECTDIATIDPESFGLTDNMMVGFLHTHLITTSLSTNDRKFAHVNNFDVYAVLPNHMVSVHYYDDENDRAFDDQISFIPTCEYDQMVIENAGVRMLNANDVEILAKYETDWADFAATCSCGHCITAQEEGWPNPDVEIAK